MEGPVGNCRPDQQEINVASVNKAILIGNLGRDPEIRYLPSGEAVATFSMATTEKWKDKTSGENKEQTEWHRCTCFGKRAEVIGEYVKKGSPLYVEGRIQTKKWTDKDGTERYTTEIVVENFQMLGRKSDSAPAAEGDKAARDHAAASGSSGARRTAVAKATAGNLDDDLDSIPF